MFQERKFSIQETGSFWKVKWVFTISELCPGDNDGITRDEFTSETDFLPNNFPAIYNSFLWTWSSKSPAAKIINPTKFSKIFQNKDHEYLTFPEMALFGLKI